MTGGEKQQVMDQVRAHGILDYLYRLRIRSNYLDTTMFEDGPERVQESQTLHSSLCRITATTLLVHELMLTQLIGTVALGRAIDEWSAGSSAVPAHIGIKARRDLVLQ